MDANPIRAELTIGEFVISRHAIPDARIVDLTFLDPEHPITFEDD